jgi:hypothetical protein
VTALGGDPPLERRSIDGLLGYRVDELTTKVSQLSQRVETGFEKLDDRLASIALMHQIEKRLDGRLDGVEKEMAVNVKSLSKSMSDNWRLTWGLFALLVTAILGSIAGLVRLFG